MPQERRNPLPVGLYWVDVVESEVPAFTAWLERAGSAIHVRETRDFEAGFWDNPLFNRPEGGTSYLFEVFTPVEWEGPGFPNVAQPGLVLEDTIARPDPEPDPVDKVIDAVESFGRVAKTGIIVAGVAAAALLVVLALRGRS